MKQVINKFLLTFAITALAALVSVQGVQAIPVDGSVSIVALMVAANDPDLNAATKFDFSLVQVGGGTGDFALCAPTCVGLPLGDFSLNIPIGAPMVLSGPLWGAATFTSITLDDNATDNQRNIFLLGNFIPLIPNFPVGLDENTASIQLGLTQQGGAGNAISLSATLNTPAVPPPGTVVPEPATLALFATGIVGLLGYGWRRNRKA